MNFEDELRDKTFKEENFGTERRVFETLIRTPKSAEIHTLQKYISLLTAHLESKGLLSTAELDELLFQATR